MSPRLSWPMLLVVSLVLISGGPPPLADDDVAKVHELAVRDEGHPVDVRPGETIRLELPSDLRNGWTWAKLTDVPALGQPENTERTISEAPGMLQVTSYPIKSALAKPIKIRWIYCRFGRPVGNVDKKPLVPGDPIREGEKPVEGMIYDVELRPASAK